MTTIISPRGTPSQVNEADQPVPASPLDAEDLSRRVDRALAALLDQELSALGFLGQDNVPVTDALTRFALEGGKRLRPAFAYWGFRGGGGLDSDGGDGRPWRPLASSLHAYALMHDDVMDASDTRRGGRPSTAGSRPATPRAAGPVTRRPSGRRRRSCWATCAWRGSDELAALIRAGLAP